MTCGMADHVAQLCFGLYWATGNFTGPPGKLQWWACVYALHQIEHTRRRAQFGIDLANAEADAAIERLRRWKHGQEHTPD